MVPRPYMFPCPKAGESEFKYQTWLFRTLSYTLHKWAKGMILVFCNCSLCFFLNSMCSCCSFWATIEEWQYNMVDRDSEDLIICSHKRLPLRKWKHNVFNLLFPVIILHQWQRSYGYIEFLPMHFLTCDTVKLKAKTNKFSILSISYNCFCVWLDIIPTVFVVCHACRNRFCGMHSGDRDVLLTVTNKSTIMLRYGENILSCSIAVCNMDKLSARLRGVSRFHFGLHDSSFFIHVSASQNVFFCKI